MKYIVFIFYILSVNFVLSQSNLNSNILDCLDNKNSTDSFIYVSGHDYVGIILNFKKVKPTIKSINVNNVCTDSFWIPTNEYIGKVETLIQQEFVTKNISNKIKDQYGIVNDSFKLEDYIRQYLGVYNNEGKKQLLVGLTRIASEKYFTTHSLKDFSYRFVRLSDSEGRFIMIRLNTDNLKDINFEF